MNLQSIKFYCERRPGGLRQLAEEAGMSEANLHRCIRNNKIQATDLEKIAHLLKISIVEFFDEQPNIHVEAHDNAQAAGRDILNGANEADIARYRDKISYLEQRIADKEATIAEKERLIQVLMEARK